MKQLLLSEQSADSMSNNMFNFFGLENLLIKFRPFGVFYFKTFIVAISWLSSQQ